MMNLLFASKFTAKLSTTLFTGAAAYCSLVEHPARMQCGTKLAATVFSPSYKRAAILQGSLVLLSSASAFTVYYLNREREWLIVGIIMATVFDYTLLCIMPTNKYLLDEKTDKESDQTKQALEKWGCLHSVRSILSLAASLILLSR